MPRCTLLAAVLLTPLAALAQPACESTLTVGSWNIQYFGQAAKAGKSTQAPADIADYISLAQVDVLALAEISAVVTGNEFRNARMDDVVKALDTKGGSWRYALFPKRPGSREPDDQWTGVLWNNARAKLVDARPAPVTIDLAKEKDLIAGFSTKEKVAVWSRTPHAVKFSAGPGKTDFVVIPLHMKSNTGDSNPAPAPGKGTSAVRAYEAQLLMEALPQMRAQFKDEDFIILGDTNMRAGDEPAGQAFKAAGFRDCNAADLGTHLAGGKFPGSPFDRIYVSTHQPETTAACTGPINGPNAFKVLWPSNWRPGITNTAFRQSMSDHVLVSTKVCVMNDDD